MVFKKNLKYSAIKFEDIEIDVQYAISINPLNEYSVSQKPIQWIKKNYDLLQQIVRGCTLELYPESSPTGRLHFHGYITIHDIFEYLKFLHGLAVYGTYCIKTITPPIDNEEEEYVIQEDSEESESPYDTWEKYCRKQQNIWIPLFANNIMCYPIEIKGAIRLPERS